MWLIMTTRISSKRLALLVGIDLYHCDGSRRKDKGEPISLKNLHGCVNDVQVIKEFLRSRFQLDDPCVLTSSPSPTNVKISNEPQDRWPTFDNIKRQFDRVKEETRAGDQFFFHFSGHGAQLNKTDSSPMNGRANDPSLMTVDYCCGKPAVRGWQLNVWLNELNEKKVQVIVSLDSCYSGGAWRSDRHFRTPEDWTPPNNLPTDEATAIEAPRMSNDRDTKLEVSWDINPEGFTLMAACQSNQRAAEQAVHGKTYGLYTYEVLKYLNQIWPTVVTYRTLRDKVATQMQSQTPQVYGQDRLAFFGNKEPVSAAPLFVVTRDGDAILSVGRFHGVKEGAQFATYSPALPITLSIDWVDDFKCGSKVTQEVSHALQQHNAVFPSRWSLEGETLTVFVQLSLGNRFQELLYANLQDRISGCIEVTNDEDYNSEDAHFRLNKREVDGGINISGPVSLIGYEGFVRGLDIKGGSDDMRATESALALAHLFRFGQILDLRNRASQNTPFELILTSGKNASNETSENKASNETSENNASNERAFSDGDGFKFTFKNHGEAELHFVVLVLSPGFHVKQLHPRWDSPKTVRGFETDSLKFCMRIPDRLKEVQAVDGHRDIIRTVVSTKKEFSVKSLELPDIWDTNQIHFRRNARLMSDTSNDDWWIKDIETHVSMSPILTERRP